MTDHSSKGAQGIERAPGLLGRLLRHATQLVPNRLRRVFYKSHNPPAKINPEIEQQLTALLETIFGGAFADAITKAPNDDARHELVATIINKQALNKRKLAILNAHRDYLQDNSPQDVPLFSKWMKILIDTYFKEHLRYNRSGVSYTIYLHDDVIQSYGYALNEGITQYFTEYMLKSNPATANSFDPSTMPYKFEVRMTTELMKRVGAVTVLRAYFSGEIDELIQAVDNLYDGGAYVKLIRLSDQAKWQEVYQFIARVPGTDSNVANING